MLRSFPPETCSANPLNPIRLEALSQSAPSNLTNHLIPLATRAEWLASQNRPGESFKQPFWNSTHSPTSFTRAHTQSLLPNQQEQFKEGRFDSLRRWAAAVPRRKVNKGARGVEKSRHAVISCMLTPKSFRQSRPKADRETETHPRDIGELRSPIEFELDLHNLFLAQLTRVTETRPAAIFHLNSPNDATHHGPAEPVLGAARATGPADARLRPQPWRPLRRQPSGAYFITLIIDHPLNNPH